VAGANRRGTPRPARRGRWTTATVLATAPVARDVRRIVLEYDGDVARPDPGGHVDVVVQVQGRPERRSYSVVEWLGGGRLAIAVKLLPAGRGGSAGMHALAVGDRIQVSRPEHLFRLSYDAPAHLLVAGGIGITPLLGMARALAARGGPLRLLYAVRSRQDAVFLDELSGLLGPRLEVACSDEGRRLRFPEAFADLEPGGMAYVCGPLPLQEAIRAGWTAAGRDPRHLRTETFGSSGSFPAESFTVRVPRLGVEVDVGADRSVLAALEDAGVEMISECLRGECGLCVLPVLDVEGVLDHRDVFLSAEQKRARTSLCTCVSRAVGGTLTLDTFDR
jgi:vanillate O-demethylase ferredoxin subunit